MVDLGDYKKNLWGWVVHNLKRCVLWNFGVSSILALIFFLLLKTVFSEFKCACFLPYLFSIIYMWIPGIFGLVFLKKEKLKINFFEKSKKWLSYSLMLPVVFTMLAIMVGSIFSPIEPDRLLPRTSFFSTMTPFYIVNFVTFYLYILVLAITCAVSVSYFCALGEEIMWRGYLWEKLKWLGFGRASFSIGMLWGLWYAPIILFLGYNYGEYRVFGVIWMIIFCLLMTPIILYIRAQSKTIASATVFHGMLKIIAHLPFMFYDQVNPLIVTTFGVSGFIVLAFMNIGLYPSYKKTFNPGKTLNI